MQFPFNPGFLFYFKYLGFHLIFRLVEEADLELAKEAFGKS